MSKEIEIKEAQQLKDPIYIDLRSPAEFEVGRVPGAINIPLFSNEERVSVGTLYKQKGPEQARDLGLAIVSPKLPILVNSIRGHVSTKRPVVLYCWRGGMRSGSIATILELMGISVYRLTSGYKAYRRFVLDQLENFSLKPEIVVLCGSTGVGKTRLLQILADRGVAIVDLEGLANHRGSAFGHVGLGKPTTAQNFDSLLLDNLLECSEQPTLLVECESKRVGNVYLPEVLYQAMQRGKKILVSASVEIRANRLMQEYLKTGSGCDEAVIASIRMLTKRLGANKVQYLVDLYQAGQIVEVVKVLLVDYYDPLYGYEQSDSSTYDLCVDASDLERAADEIGQYIVSIRR